MSSFQFPCLKKGVLAQITCLRPYQNERQLRCPAGSFRTISNLTEADEYLLLTPGGVREKGAFISSNL